MVLDSPLHLNHRPKRNRKGSFVNTVSMKNPEKSRAPDLLGAWSISASESVIVPPSISRYTGRCEGGYCRFMAGQPSHRKRRFLGRVGHLQRRHSPRMVTLEVGSHFKLKQKCHFVTIPAPAAGSATRSRSAPVPTPWSAATRNASPVPSWTASTSIFRHASVAYLHFDIPSRPPCFWVGIRKRLKLILETPQPD